jgi:hypothetical protein
MTEPLVSELKIPEKNVKVLSLSQPLLNSTSFNSIATSMERNGLPQSNQEIKSATLKKNISSRFMEGISNFSGPGKSNEPVTPKKLKDFPGQALVLSVQKV